MYLRRNVPISSVDVIASMASAPFVAAYRFNRGWEEKFSDPSPALTYVGAGAGDARVAPTNAHLVSSGQALELTTFDLGSNDIDNGVTFDPPGSVLPNSLAFADTADALVIGGNSSLMEYSYSGSTIGTLTYTIDNPGSVGVLEKVYCREYLFIMRGAGISASDRGTIFLHDRAAGNLTTNPTTERDRYDAPISASGGVQSMSLSTQKLTSGNDVVVVVDEDLVLIEVVSGLFNHYYTAGVDGPAIGATYAAVASNNRIIIARPGFIDCYQLNGNGTITFNHSMAFTGNVTAMDFDITTDVLFIGTDSTPWIHAYPLNASGFGAKFADPAVLPGSTINRLTVRFPSWTNFVA